MEITKVSLARGQRCPTCGELPYIFRSPFARRVDEQYIIPKKSIHYSADANGKPFQYEPSDGCYSPEGLYSGVIVPKRLIGKVVMIKEEDANDILIEQEKRKQRKKKLGW